MADGTYKGAFETSLVKATVAVTVESNRVIAQQTTKVDVVSGATGSRLVILKAIEQAVTK